MMRLIRFGIIALLLATEVAWAGQTFSPFTGKLDRCLTISETDGSPSNVICGDLAVSNGTLTDDGDGTYTLNTTGGSTQSFETISVPAGTAPVADSSTDTLTITEDSFLTITGTAGTDTIAITQVTTDIGTDGLIASNAVALSTDTTGNYVEDVTAGAGLTKTSSVSEAQTVDLAVGAGTAIDVSADAVDFDSTEVEATTWGAGGNASNAWTFNLSGVDPVLTIQSGSLSLAGDFESTGTGPDHTLIPTGGKRAGMHAELQGASDTLFYLKNDTRFLLMEFPGGLFLGGTDTTASVPKLVLRATTTGNAGIVLQDAAIGSSEIVGGLVKCAAVENLAAADDNMPLGSFPVAVTITAVWCHCYGTCTTPATIQLEDDAGNAMTGTATCDTGGGAATPTVITAGGSLIAYEGMRFDTTNAVSPETDEYSVCVGY